MIKRQLLITAITLTLVTPWTLAQQTISPNTSGAEEHQQHHPGASDMTQNMEPGDQSMEAMQQRWSDMEKRMEQMAATDDATRRHEMMQQMREEMKQLMMGQHNSQGMGANMLMGQQGMLSGMMPMMGNQGMMPMMGQGMARMMGQHQAVMARLQAIELRLNVLEAQ